MAADNPNPNAVAVGGTQPRHVTVAATQFACSNDIEANLRKAENLIRDAAKRGANIILLQELFATPYFPIEQRDYYGYAIDPDEDKSYLRRFQMLANELNVVLPLSFYERSNNAHFNSVLMIDSDGSQLGIYRKSHIPDGPGYQEKYYFTPGNTGFKVFHTNFGKIGVGICWDQWFPEAARVMAIQGAEILLFPTAIGSEPHAPALDSSGHWQRCMQGHSAANLIPIVASNRIGKEMAKNSDVSVTFYGSSFMTDHTGLIVADAGRYQETILVNTFNFSQIKYARLQWDIFRDRRPDLYTKLRTFDGLDNNLERRAPCPEPPQRTQNVYRTMPVTTATAIAAAASLPPTMQTTGPIATTKKMESDVLMSAGMMTMDGNSNVRGRRLVPENIDLHEASYIGDVKEGVQRRPRGRCWVCRNKTTLECKVCDPGPVPLCNRTARDCWNKYHFCHVSQFIPNKRGRKRKSIDTQPVMDHAQQQQQVQQHVGAQVQQVGQVQQVPVGPVAQHVQPQHHHHHHENGTQEQGNSIQAPDLNGDDVDAVKVAAQGVGGPLGGDIGVGELLH